MKPFYPEFVVRFPAQDIPEVLSAVQRALEDGVPTFKVEDDRGGSGCWALVFDEQQAGMTRRRLRRIVGPKEHIEEC